MLKKNFSAVLIIYGLLMIFSCGKYSSGNLAVLQDKISMQTIVNTKLVPIAISTNHNFAKLPIDYIQPWEKLTSYNHITKSQYRSISGLYPDSEFQSGVDRFLDDGVSKPNGEAIRLASGNAGEKKLAWAMWRLVMSGIQPGVITIDANLGSADAKYFVAISDYKRNCWQWLGEFNTPHAIIPMKSGEYLSKLGNAFVVVFSYNGASVDIVGAGAHPVTSSDTTPPDEVINPKAEAVPGGLLLSWDKVAAADLAGYQISNNNKLSNSLTNTTYALIPYKSGKVTISAIDTSNKSSKPVEITIPDTLITGDVPKINLITDITGTQRNGKANLKATCELTGAKFDFDLDGDGVFETLDNSNGEIISVYKDTGILRPAVRAKDSSGIIRAFSAVSLIVTSNSRPVVDITVDKSYGQAPLEVKYSAEFQDFDGIVTQLWWDANGDGIYEAPIETPISPESSSTSLSTVGITNARVRVADNDGATDVANVAVQVAADPTNVMPVITAISTNINPNTAGSPISFDVTATDPDGSIASYSWSFKGATPTSSTDQKPTNIVYSIAGFYNASIKVTDNKGGYTVGFIGVSITDNPGPLLEDIYEPDDNKTSHSINPTETMQAQSLSIYPANDVDWINFWGVAGLTYELSSLSKSKFDIIAYLYNANNALILSDDDSGGGNQFRITWTCPKFGFYYIKIIAKNSASSGSYSFDFQHTYQGIWHQKGYDNARNGCSFFIGPKTNTLKWSYTTGDKIYSSPAISTDGTIYVGSRDNNLYALNSDGSVKWKYTTSSGIYDSSPAIGADGTVYVGSNDKYFYAVNPDGSQKWSYLTGNGIYSSPAIGQDGTVYFGGVDNTFYALNSDGSKNWTYKTTGAFYSSPAIDKNGIIYVGCMDKKLYAFNIDGTVKWTYPIGGLIESSPAIGVDGVIYIGSDDNKIYAIKPDGSIKWTYTTGAAIYFAAPAINSLGTIYFGSNDNKLYALNPDGSLKWTFTTGDDVWAMPTIGTDGTIYFGSLDKTFYALNPDGTIKWTYTTGAQISNSAAIGVDGTVYFGSWDNKIYAIGPGEGY